MFIAKEKKQGMELHGTHEVRLVDGEMIHEIIINKDSPEISDTIIHELIHASLNEMIINDKKLEDESLRKLAARVNRREDFINRLSRHISDKIKLTIKSYSPKN